MKHTGLVGFVLLSSSTLGAGFFGCSAGVEREIGERAADGGFVEPDDTSSPTPTGTFNTSGDAGQKSGCPDPSPALFDFPGDGCDQDGDGKDGNESCDTGTAETGSAWDFAKALGLCQTTKETDAKWGVISAQYTTGYQQSNAPKSEAHGILKKFGNVIKPREGEALGVISSGWAREYNGTKQEAFRNSKTMGGGKAPPGFPKSAKGCTAMTNVNDVSAVKLVIKVPENAKGLRFDFNFHSSEWPDFICSGYNDSFIAYLKGSGFNKGAADNISFDAQNNPVSVNNGFFDRCTPNTTVGCKNGGILGAPTTSTSKCPGGELELAGTGFDAQGTYCGSKSTGGGSTGWLGTKAPVTPGEIITLEFMIWDTGDSAYDSSVLLDNFSWEPKEVVTETERLQ